MVRRENPLRRRTVLQTSALALGALGSVSTVSGSDNDNPSLPNTVRIEGTGSVAGYQLTVNGAIVKNSESTSGDDETVVDGRTIIDGTTVTGIVGSCAFADAFDYAGDITDIQLAGEPDIFVNDTHVDPADLTSEEDSGPPAAADLSDHTMDGTAILVDRIEMSLGGYVSIHDARRRLYHEDIEENGIGSQEAISDSFIGLTDYLEPGKHYNVEIPLFDHSPWDLPGESPQGPDVNRLEESQPVLPIPHIPTDAPEFQLGEDGAYTEGPRTLEDVPVIHDIGTVYVEGASDEERIAAKKEEIKARQEFGG